jgi:hypothetical protein
VAVVLALGCSSGASGGRGDGAAGATGASGNSAAGDAGGGGNAAAAVGGSGISGAGGGSICDPTSNFNHCIGACNVGDFCRDNFMCHDMHGGGPNPVPCCSNEQWGTPDNGCGGCYGHVGIDAIGAGCGGQSGTTGSAGETGGADASDDARSDAVRPDLVEARDARD